MSRFQRLSDIHVAHKPLKRLAGGGS